MSATTTFRSSSVGSMISLRLKASSWRVSPVALAPALLISAMSIWRGSSGIEIVQHQVAVPENHGQQIVEVVRDAAGQPPDGFHLLRLLVLLFERAALGDVQRDPDAAQRCAVRVEVDAARAGQPPHGAVRPDRPVLDREIVAALLGLLERRHDRRPIVGMNPIDERREGSAERAGLQAVLGLEGGGPAEHAGGVVHVPDPDVRALQREPHALFRRAHGLRGLLAAR